MKGCEHILEDLPGYASGKLTASERSIVDAHVRGCDGCLSELHSTERLERLLLGLPKVEPSPDLRSRFANRLAAEIDAEAARSERGGGIFRWLMRPWLVPSLVTAALAVTVLVGSLGGNQIQAPQAVARAPVSGAVEKGVVAKPAGENVVAAAKPSAAKPAVSIADSRSQANVPPALETETDLFVDYAIIRDLEALQANEGSESAG